MSLSGFIEVVREMECSVQVWHDYRRHFFINLFIYLFMAALGLRCCVGFL